MFDIKGLEQKKAAKVAELNDSIALTEKEDRMPNAEEKQKRADLEGGIVELNARIADVRAAMDRERGVTSAERSANPNQAVEGDKPETLGQFLQATAFLSGYSKADRIARLYPQVREHAKYLAAATGLNERSAGDGGLFVEHDMATEILRPVYETGVILSRVARRPVDGNGLKMRVVKETSRAEGSRFGGVQVYYRDEAGSVTAKKPQWETVDLELNSCMGLFYATDELLEDAAALGGEVQQYFAEELQFTAEDKVINGTGAGCPQGILNASALVTVAKETGQVAATLVAENLKNMWSRMPGRNRTNAIFIYEQSIEPQLMGLIQVAGFGGAPIFMPPGGLSAAPYGTILGRPAIAVEYCSALGTKGDIIFADFSQYKFIEKSRGIQFDSSIHVAFTTKEQVFRIEWRHDGRPIPRSAVSPKSGGSDTRSPFVTLATRA